MLCSSTHHSSFSEWCVLFFPIYWQYMSFIHKWLLLFCMTVEIGLLIKQAKSSATTNYPQPSYCQKLPFFSTDNQMLPSSSLCRSYHACPQINILTAEHCSLADGSLTSFGRSQFLIKIPAAISGGSLFYSVPQAPARLIPQFRLWMLPSHPSQFIN